MNTKAPEGKIWQCAACGKKARWRYGFDPKNIWDCDYGYDESCMLNAVLVDEQNSGKLETKTDE